MERPWQVAVRVAPPFVISAEDGAGGYHGLSIELWERMADQLGLNYEYVELDLQAMLDAASGGEVDLAVAALTVTAERERAMDFTHPFHTSGLGIAVSGRSRHLNWLAALSNLFTWRFISVAAGLILILLITGFLVLLCERKRNPSQFGGGWLAGAGSAFWWSAVTMTTVGYGDKAPKSLAGRMVALVWMFASIVMISGFTAAIASALTVSSMEHAIRGPEDLARIESAALAGSTSEQYLAARNWRYRTSHDLQEALLWLREGRVEAVVHDAPILRYLTAGDEGLEVLPETFQRQDYGFALPSDSEWRQELNVALLEITQSPWWEERLRFYLRRGL